VIPGGYSGRRSAGQHRTCFIYERLKSSMCCCGIIMVNGSSSYDAVPDLPAGSNSDSGGLSDLHEESGLAPRPSGLGYNDGSFSHGLGALRGIAAVGVVVFHAFLFVPIDGIHTPHQMGPDLSDPSLTTQHFFLGLFNGSGLVTLFFVLSGCVLALSLDRKPSFALGDWPGYLMRRGLRLYPLLIVAATSGALLQIAIGFNALEAASTWAHQQYQVPNEDLLFAWFKNAMGASSSLNSPGWSIRVELIASALFPVLYLLSRGPVRACLTFAGLILAMFIVPGTFADMHVFLFCFFVGAVVPRVGQAVVSYIYTWSDTARWLAVAATLLAFMFSRRLIDPFSHASGPVILTESLCAGFVVALTLYGRPLKFFRNSVVQWLGRASYGIYLFHLIVLFALAHIFLPAWSASGILEEVLLVVLLLAGTMFVTLPLAWLSYNALEYPFQRLGGGLEVRLRETVGWLKSSMIRSDQC
jgi:peptidoglycan/LPS O-acetylase OafA/YrhL